MRGHRALADQVARGLRVLAQLGAADLMSHLTARLPSPAHLLATPGWGAGPGAPHLVRAADLLTLDRDGAVVAGEGAPSPLVALDLAAYRLRPTAGAVAFACPRLTCAFGIARRPMQALPHMGGELAAQIAVADVPGLPVTPERAEAILRATEAPIIQLPGLGVLVIGRDVIDVVSTVYTVEESLARANAVAARLNAGTLRTLRAEEMARIVAQRAGRGAYEAFFAALDRPPRRLRLPGAGTDETTIRRQMALACRILAAQGTLVAFLEHVSHRLPGTTRWLMSPAKAFGRMTPEDMIVLDDAAQRVSGPAPARFRFYHRDILRRRPDVCAIVHTHDLFGRVFVQAGVPAQPVWRNGALACREAMPVFAQADLLFDDAPRRGAVEALDGHAAVHTLGHGTDFVAPTLEEATVRAVQREELLRMQFLALQLGTPAPLPEPTLDDLAAHDPGWRRWWVYHAVAALLGGAAPAGRERGGI